MRRQRADLVLVARGLFESRAKAQEAIAAGLVKVEGLHTTQGVGTRRATGAHRGRAQHTLSSRAAASSSNTGSTTFGFDPAGKICLDVGASTGGFTDVLLRRGAAQGLLASMSGTANCTRRSPRGAKSSRWKGPMRVLSPLRCSRRRRN